MVQVYITAPGKRMNKPAIELKAFAKTRLLAPGEKQTLQFVLTAADLASFDPDRSIWVAEPGEYQVKVGASSLNILQTAKFTLAKEIITEKCNKVMLPEVPVQELMR